MDLAPLYTLTGTAEVEKLGKVQDGERIKIEFRGKSAADSPIAGKAHGSSWILVGPMGPGETNAVQEIITPAGERLVVELRGYAATLNGDGMEIRASGIIRASAANFSHLNGRVAVVVQKVAKDNAVAVTAYSF
ncbi:MAG: hypothetical protein ACHQ4J_07320 [Candidatus Binatia bacterium]